MEFKWDQFTAFRLILPYILGIVAAVYVPFFTEIGQNWLLLPMFCALIGFIALQLTKMAAFSVWRMLSGIFMFAFLFFLGTWNTQNHNELNQSEHFGHYLVEKATDETTFLMKLTEPIVPKPNSYKATAEVIEVLQAGQISQTANRTTGQAILYFSKNDSTDAPPLKYGDVLLAKNNFKHIAPPQNPEQFDFQRYLRFQNIFHQAYLRETDWQILNENRGNTLMAQVFELREYLLTVLLEKIEGKSEQAVAAALLLGYKHLLEKDIQAVYQNTGAMHVLAVSGLHVGILMMILGSLLSFVNRFRFGKIIHLLLMLSGIWAFALLTGLAPSVFRSALMFSLVAIGNYSNRNVSSLNIVAASGVLLLFYNPNLLFQVGFQLSYMAVLAIIYLYPKLTEPFDIETWILRKAWQVSAVSIAATIGTLPLSLHYFNQFPVYFLLSNFVITIAAGLIIGTGIATFAFARIPFVGDGLAWVLEKLIAGVNFSLSFMEHLPYSVIEGLYLPPVELFLVYAVLLLGLLFFRLKSTRILNVSLLFACLLFGHIAFRQLQVHQSNSLTVFQVRKQSSIAFQAGKNSSIFGSDEFKTDKNSLDFTLQPVHLKSGIRNFSWIDKKTSNQHATQHPINNHLAVHWPFLQFQDKRILLIEDRWKLQAPETFCLENLGGNALELDYLILSNNQFVPLTDLLETFAIKQVIIDDSNQFSKVRYWTKVLDKQGVPYHYTKADGAFVEKL